MVICISLLKIITLNQIKKYIKKCIVMSLLCVCVYIYITVWANFALGSNSVKGKAQPNILYEEIRTSEDDQPRNGRNYHPRRGAAC